MYKYIVIAILVISLIYFGFSNIGITEHFYVAKSNIAGEGLFASEDIESNKKLFKALDLNQTILNEVKKVNHCNKPNTYLVKENDGWYVYSKKKLAKNEELSIDYWDTPDFIRKPEPHWTC